MALLAMEAGAGEARSVGSGGHAPGPVCTVAKSVGTTLAGTIALETDPGLPPRVVASAIALWSACANYGSGFPRLVAGTLGTRVIRVEPVSTPQGRRCGSFEASTIRLYPVALEDGRPVPCLPPDRILAHEIGHALGLADAPARSECRDHIMAQSFEPHAPGRRVQPSECQAVGQHWLTPDELRDQERVVTEWSERPSVQEDPR
jgi:hypothetical protein